MKLIYNYGLIDI